MYFLVQLKLFFRSFSSLLYFCFLPSVDVLFPNEGEKETMVQIEHRRRAQRTSAVDGSFSSWLVNRLGGHI